MSQRANPVAIGAFVSEFLLPDRMWTIRGHFTGEWHFSVLINSWVLCVRHPTIANYQKVTMAELTEQFKSVPRYDLVGVPTFLTDPEPEPCS